jgi:hypothetical protein
MHVVENVKLDDEELYLPDDILEEASAARYQILKKLEKFSEWKAVSESEVNERETFTYW